MTPEDSRLSRPTHLIADTTAEQIAGQPPRFDRVQETGSQEKPKARSNQVFPLVPLSDP